MNFKVISPLLIALSVISLFANRVKAQNLKGQPDPFQSNEQDPFEGSSGINPMDLIHNAHLLNLRSGTDFVEDTNRSLDTATDDFKKQQLKRLMEMQQAQPVTTDSDIADQPE